MLRGASRLAGVAVAVATAAWLPALASGEPPQPPPNFKVSASGRVGFGVDPVTCPGGFVITASSAPASGTHIGGEGDPECARVRDARLHDGRQGYQRRRRVHLD